VAKPPIIYGGVPLKEPVVQSSIIDFHRLTHQKDMTIHLETLARRVLLQVDLGNPKWDWFTRRMATYIIYGKNIFIYACVGICMHMYVHIYNIFVCMYVYVRI
jgi:hypothetical protein